ncbi:hypothetical protein ccbrp13_15810 [Ktedonobacteria bacterium brp13]|nr:hypothetical protein ccbrp13_15810 [Ktedonobacteria bacterium brp13]
MLAILDTDPEQKGRSKHDEGHMVIPANVAAYLIVIEPKIFGIFKVHLDPPACTDGQNYRV